MIRAHGRVGQRWPGAVLDTTLGTTASGALERRVHRQPEIVPALVRGAEDGPRGLRPATILDGAAAALGSDADRRIQRDSPLLAPPVRAAQASNAVTTAS